MMTTEEKLKLSQEMNFQYYHELCRIAIALGLGEERVLPTEDEIVAEIQKLLRRVDGAESDAGCYHEIIEYMQLAPDETWMNRLEACAHALGGAP